VNNRTTIDWIKKDCKEIKGLKKDLELLLSDTTNDKQARSS